MWRLRHLHIRVLLGSLQIQRIRILVLQMDAMAVAASILLRLSPLVFVYPLSQMHRWAQARGLAWEWGWASVLVCSR